MRQFYIALLLSLIFPLAALSQDSVKLVTLRSKIFGNTRTLRVLLPKDYEASTAIRYPVLYFNDGFAVFKYWNLAGSIATLTQGGKIPPLIVVGIDNSGETNRAGEYLPYKDESNPDAPPPNGNKYPDFLANEVIPLIEKEFRTGTGPENRGLGGSSYGAYIALYTAIHKPGLFGKLLLESTPLFIADFQILKDAETAKDWPERINIGVGTKETDDEEVNSHIASNANRLASIIKKSNPKANVRVFLQKNAKHGSKAWSERLPAALEFLFPNPS